MTFTEWLLQETAKDEDNILPPPLEPQLALNFLREYILGEDWYSANPVPTAQINTEVVEEILYKCSKRYRKEVRNIGNKENAELKEKVSYLEDNLRVARKDRENLQLKVGKGLNEFIKHCPYSALKLYANGYYVEQLTQAKEIIQKLYNIVCGRSGDDWGLIKQAEKFIREVE